MSSSSRAGGGSGSAAIPANARKTVQNLKEIVSNSEDEIYAMLKECNMDVDETAQRLLTLDPFHEVKRRRDKKREGVKDIADSRPRPSSGGQARGGGRGGQVDRGSGRGNSLPRHEFNGGGRGKSFPPRENGSVNSRTSSAYGGTSSSASPAHGQQQKSPASGVSAVPSSVPASTSTVASAHQNGGPGYPRPASVSQSTWGASPSGHATMADIVKANGAPPPPTVPPPVATPPTAPVGTPLPSSIPQYSTSSTGVSPSVSSGVYSSSTDPVLHPSLDPRAVGTPGTIKRELGTVGPTRPKQANPMNVESLSTSSAPSQSLQIPAGNTSSVATSSLEIDGQVVRPSSPPASVSHPVLPDQIQSAHTIPGETSVSSASRQGGSGSGTGGTGPRSVVGAGPFSSRPVYQPQQHPVGTHKVSGSGLEWKPKPPSTSPNNLGIPNTSAQAESVRSSPAVPLDPVLSSQTSKMQGLSIRDNSSVIIPNHLQVPEAERPHLSFGSFGAGFGTSFSTSFGNDEKPSAAITESVPAIETDVEQAIDTSVPSSAPSSINQSYVHQNITVPEETLVSSIDTAVVSIAPATLVQSDVRKPDPVVPQAPQYSYLPPLTNYGFSLMPTIPGSAYAYEPAETTSQDVNRLPGLMPYADPTTSYYTPPYRPVSDGDARYPQFLASNASSKYSGNLGLMNLTGQGLGTSQEAGNAVMQAPVSAAQTSQAGTAQSVQTIPQQQHLPLHAYTGQPAAPLGHFTNVFGYQYLPTSYPYVPSHAPYQHNYATTSGYPQPPAANSYAPTAASSYPPAGAGAVKYISQYKPGTAAGSAPHSAAAQAYGGYATPPSAYVANPTVTVGNATGYEEVVPQQYKDNNLYIPNQQAEGSAVWVRDMAAAGMQTSSFYNLGQQGQHTYAHAQQASHAHPAAYASLYHPTQSGPTPTPHQLLQQPQSLAAQGAAAAAQAGGYQQQPQRAQQTWTNSY